MIKKRIDFMTFGLIICLICSVIMSGCGQTENPTGTGNGVSENKSPEVMSVSGCSVTEADYYLYLIQYIYNYNVIPEQLTENNIELLMQTATNDLKIEFLQSQMAKEAGLILSDEQMETMNLMMTAFYATFGEEFLTGYGIDETAVRNMIERQLYVYLLTDQTTNDLITEYTREYEEEYADYHFHNMFYVVFPNFQVDDEGQTILDDEGNSIPLTEEEMAEQMALAEEFRERAVNGAVSADESATMEILAQEYGVAPFSGVQVNVNGAYTEELNQLVASLSNGDISEVILTDVGYMIVRMDNSDDTELMAQMIADFAKDSAKEYLPYRQQSWLEESGIRSIEPNQELLGSIDIPALCNDMIARGIRFDQSSLNLQ